jgi:glycosyltransferase involved in cell wall biosynthesis
MSVRVSVVVPTYKRPQLIHRCLGALLAQDLDAQDYEVIVADDGADDETRRVVEGWMMPQAPRVRYIAVRGRHGPAAARNCGWRAAQGEIIAFTDDDCVPSPGWLSSGLAALTDDLAAVGGRIVIPLPPEPTDYELDAARLQTSEFVTANCFCRRAVLAEQGGLDENFRLAWREDSDLFFSLIERGYKVARAPQAVVTHPIRPASWGVSMRQQRKILFDALLYKKHPQLYRSRIRPGPPWRYYGTAGALLTALCAAAVGAGMVAAGAGALWGLMTGRMCLMRLRHTSHRIKHVAEMAVTSALIPPLAVFWRLFGAVKFRVVFF